MAKINELVYDVREAVEQFSSDSDLDNRYIIYLYNIKRAKYLRQDLNNFQKSWDNSIMQTFCVPMEIVSAETCSRNLECTRILRSKVPLPKAIELTDKVAISRVKPTNITSLPFTFLSLERGLYFNKSRFPKSIYAFIDTDNYLYAVSENESMFLINCITVSGIFEDPLSLQEFKDCCDCKDSNVCFDPLESEYPLQPHYIDLIKNEIVNEVLRKLEIPQDKNNNARED